jgi:YhcN/YlaJ family sporulation lipoprotein
MAVGWRFGKYIVGTNKENNNRKLHFPERTETEMHNQKLGFIGALLLTFAGVTGACSGDQGAAPKANQADQTHQVRVQQSAPNVNEERSQATVERLEQLAEGISEVKHANCVIFGNTAIVGIDVAGDIDRSRVGTIKYAVAEALRQDPVGINAIVTADMDLNHRLQEIRQDIKNGRAMQGMAEEMADIVGRIIPQLPRDTEQREAPPEPKATTQERGVDKSGAASWNGTLPDSESGEPQSNKDFQSHPANDK